MNVHRLYNLGLGSFDLWDFTIRILRTAPDDTDMRWSRSYFERDLAVFHEFFHYVQMVTSRVGLGHILHMDSIAGLLESRLAPHLGREVRTPFASYLERTPKSCSEEFKSLQLRLNEVSSVWRFHEIDHGSDKDLRTTLEWAQEHPDIPLGQLLRIDSDLGVVSIGPVVINIGLHGLCEQMARCAEYTWRLWAGLERRGLNNPEDIRAVKSGQIDLSHWDNEIHRFPWKDSAFVYDFPLLLALQRGCFPANVVTTFALLCGWISLMNTTWLPGSDVPQNVAGGYLEMLDNGLELAHDLYFEERGKLLKGDNKAFNAIQMADRICDHFDQPPFSKSIEEVTGILERLMDESREEGAFQSQIYWCARDGHTILKAFTRTPIRLLAVFPRYETAGESVSLPVPPVFYENQAWGATGEGGRHRTFQHLLISVLKEMLFASHDFSAQGRSIGDLASEECPYGDCCIFRARSSSIKQSLETALGHLDGLRGHSIG